MRRKVRRILREASLRGLVLEIMQGDGLPGAGAAPLHYRAATMNQMSIRPFPLISTGPTGRQMKSSLTNS